MKIARCGLDIAKQVFQLHGVDASGHVLLRRTLPRSKVRALFVSMEPCVVGIEACGGSHYWARELRKLGHTVQLMAANFVSAYRKSGKNDVNDAEEICEAVERWNSHWQNETLGYLPSRSRLPSVWPVPGQAGMNRPSDYEPRLLSVLPSIPRAHRAFLG
jgi:hypothetical protein